MKIISGLVQGSPEWHQHRANHFNASDAPAMLGISPYKTRSQLLAERFTGIMPEIDGSTQQRFNDGHRFEALARPLAEDIIGDELSPVTGARDEYSASFDGITFDGSVIFEHKTLNDSLRTILSNPVVTGSDLDLMYQVQMEHQLSVSEAEKCLFMASAWDENDNLREELHCWYYPNKELRNRIGMGWIQFKKDLANYQHVEHAEKPKSDAIMDLPALSVQATGMVTYSNLPEFKAAAENYIENINTDLQTDQHFADAEATVKFCKATEEKLEVTKAAILAQTSTIDEVIRTVSYIQEQLSRKRLVLDKLVKSEKDARKTSIILKAKAAMNDHITSLHAEIKGVNLIVQMPDFADVIKGMKKLSAMQEAVDNALRNGMYEADVIAKDIREKLVIYSGTAACGYEFLFRDLQTLIAKPKEDFELVIHSRVQTYIDGENAKREAERVRIQAEADAKAQAAAQKTIDDAAAKAKAENDATIDAMVAKKHAEQARLDEYRIGREAAEQAAIEEKRKHAQPDEQSKPLKHSAASVVSPTRPSRSAIIEALADHFGVGDNTALDWILAEFRGDIQHEERKAA